MTRALTSPDPMAAHPPMHPSYEDRADAPDRIFAKLDDEDAEHQVAAWARALQSVDAAGADVLHLHHLTPIYEAALRVAPEVPIVGHLHGTELLMLEAIERDPHRWPYGQAWAERMRGWAARCERIIVLSETQVERAERLLPIEHERCVLIPNGFDPDNFTPAPHRPPRAVAADARRRSRAAGRPAASPAPCATPPTSSTRRSGTASGETPVLLYVGRFTEVKRIPLLIEAYERARPGFIHRAPLVLVGGFPGEWEGEHPLQTIRAPRRAGRLPGRLARAPRAAGHPRRDRRDRAAVGPRAVRPGARRGDGVRPAGDRRRRPRPGRHRRPTARPAGSSSPTTARPGQRARRGRQPPGRASPPRRDAAEDVADRYAWPALARDVAALYDEARDGARDASRRNNVAHEPRTNALNAARDATDRGPGTWFPGGPLLLCRSLPSPRMGFRVPHPSPAHA